MLSQRDVDNTVTIILWRFTEIDTFNRKSQNRSAELDKNYIRTK